MIYLGFRNHNSPLLQFSIPSQSSQPWDVCLKKNTRWENVSCSYLHACMKTWIVSNTKMCLWFSFIKRLKIIYLRAYVFNSLNAKIRPMFFNCREKFTWKTIVCVCAPTSEHAKKLEKWNCHWIDTMFELTFLHKSSFEKLYGELDRSVRICKEGFCWKNLPVDNWL